MYNIQKLTSHLGRNKINLRVISCCKCNSSIPKDSTLNPVQIKYFSSPSSKNVQPFLANGSRPHVGSFHNQRKSSGKAMPSISEEFRHLDYNQLNEQRVQEKSCVIDVREKSELDETGTIPGAHHIPLGDIPKALATPEEQFRNTYKFPKPSLEDNIIFSCRSGKRSLAALEKALHVGYTNAKHYKGGWLDWEKNIAEPR